MSFLFDLRIIAVSRIIAILQIIAVERIIAVSVHCWLGGGILNLHV